MEYILSSTDETVDTLFPSGDVSSVDYRFETVATVQGKVLVIENRQGVITGELNEDDFCDKVVNDWETEVVLELNTSDLDLLELDNLVKKLNN